MRVTIVRHGKAVDRAKWHLEDADRPLTKEGAAQAMRAFRTLRGWVAADEVWTSPWTRARQTAELAAECWRLPLREVDWLAGEAMSADRRIRLLPHDIDVALVGHEPDLGMLIGALAGGRPVPLKKGGVALLEGEPAPAGMQLRLLLTPKLVLGLADS